MLQFFVHPVVIGCSYAAEQERRIINIEKTPITCENNLPVTGEASFLGRLGTPLINTDNND